MGNEGDKHTLARWALRVLAMALWWPCVFQADFSVWGWDGSATPASALSLYVLPVLLAIAFAAPVIGRRRPRAEGKSAGGGPGIGKRTLLATGALASLGYLLQTFAGMSAYSQSLVGVGVPFALPAPWGIAGICLCAAFLIAYPLWLGEDTLEREPGPLLVAIASSYALSELLQLAVHLLPIGAQVVYRVACPLAAALLATAGGAIDRDAGRGPGRRDAPDASRRVLVVTIVFCVLLMCFVRAFSQLFWTGDVPAAMRSVPVPLVALVLMSALALFFRKTQAERVGTVVAAFVFLAVIYMGCLLVVVLFPELRMGLARQLMLATGHSFTVYLLALLAWGNARGMLRPQASVSAYPLLAVGLPLLEQDWLCPLLQGTGGAGSLYTVIACLALFVIAVALIVLVGAIGLRRESIEPRKSQEEWLAEHCKEALAPAGLTPKELETTILVYRGFTAERAAERMHVKQTTVNTHLAHVYRKLGIHTRQELIDYVDSAGGK